MKLFCWILDKSESSFPVDVAHDDTVDDLKKEVMKTNSHALAGLDAVQLTIYKVSIKVTKNLKNEVSKYQLVEDDFLLESDILSDAFPNPVQGYLHVVVQIPFVGPGKRKPGEPAEGVHDRLKRTRLATMTPSDAGEPSLYLNLQNDPSEKILDDRPHPDADIPPIPLLYDGFGHFLDVMAGHDDVPGLADVQVRELHDAVDDFASKMTGYFGHEDERRDVGLNCLNKIFAARRATPIPPISSAAIGSIRSDGHNIAIHGSGTMGVEFKNSIAGINSLPTVELTGYVARLVSRMDQQIYEGWRVPCLGLTIVGCDITFYAIIAIDHRFRIIALTPTFSCIASASDGRDRTCLYSAFVASSVLQACLIQDATTISRNPAAIIPTPARLFPAVTRLRSYPPSNQYFSFEIQSFFPERLPNCLLYVAETPGPDKQRVVIKFARKYSIELHDFCARLGHAPAIYAFERLPGGWCAVAMRYVKSATPITHSPLLPTHRQLWEGQLRALMKKFHDQGLCHGDLRSPNIACEGQSVMLLDFDWGGKEGEACYPTWRLNEELLAGRVSEDLKITKDDDLRVLTNTLNRLG